MQQWEMTEVFTFPNVLGNVIEGTSFKVEPNWQYEVTKESVLLKGVYVVKGHVNFDFEPNEDEEKIEGIYIEHLDIEKDKAYFEYAIPFSIDLPNEGDSNVKMKVIDPQVKILKGSNCSCTWQVSCDIEKKETVIKEKPINEEVHRLPERQETPKVKAKQETPKMEVHQAAPEVVEKVETPKVEVHQEAPKVVEKVETPKVEVHQETPKVVEQVETPKVKVHQETPKVVEQAETPKVKVHQETPKVVEQVEIAKVKVQQEVQIELEQQNIQQVIEQHEVNEVYDDLDAIKAIVKESKTSSSEEVDFFDQLAEAYSVIQVHLNNRK